MAFNDTGSASLLASVPTSTSTPASAVTVPAEYSSALQLLAVEFSRGLSAPASLDRLTAARQLLETSASTGHLDSLFRLGTLLTSGLLNSSAPDAAAASLSSGIEYLSRSSSLGHLNSRFELANIYLSPNNPAFFNFARGLELFLSLAADDNAEPHRDSLFNLGQLYLHLYYHESTISDKINYSLEKLNSFIEYSPARAIHYYRRASDLSDSASSFQLGQIYLEGIPNKIDKNSELAIQFLLKAAEAGHSGAAANLGFCALNGDGMEKNLQFAHYWLEKAASLGQRRALKALGDLHWNGENELATPDYRKSAEFYQVLAGSPWNDAESKRKLVYCWFNLGNQLENPIVLDSGKFQEIIKLLSESAASGDGEAACSLGAIFHVGAPGVEIDLIKSNQYYLQAANAGIHQAQLNYALALLDGSSAGVERNEFEAVRYLRLAAISGLPAARFHLARALHSGSGVQANHSEAKRQLELAAREGSETAEEALREWEFDEE